MTYCAHLIIVLPGAAEEAIAPSRIPDRPVCRGQETVTQRLSKDRPADTEAGSPIILATGWRPVPRYRIRQPENWRPHELYTAPSSVRRSPRP